MYEGAVCTNPYVRRASDVSVIVYTQMVRGSLNDDLEIACVHVDVMFKALSGC